MALNPEQSRASLKPPAVSKSDLVTSFSYKLVCPPLLKQIPISTTCSTTGVFLVSSAGKHEHTISSLCSATYWACSWAGQLSLLSFFSLNDYNKSYPFYLSGFLHFCCQFQQLIKQKCQVLAESKFKSRERCDVVLKEVIQRGAGSSLLAPPLDYYVMSGKSLDASSTPSLKL